MNTRMVSVIVPVYKAEATIEKCVHSILANSVSLELILVDDGSPYRSGAVCDQLAAGDSRVKVLHKENGGVGSARNTGMAMATGRYLVFVDADDTISADMYGPMVQKAEETGADCVICNIVNLYTTHKVAVSHVFGDQVIAGAGQIHERIILPLITPGHADAALMQSPVNKLYRRDVIQQHDLRFSHLPYAEDWLFNIEYFMHSKTAAFIKDYSYFYDRTTEGSLSKSWRKDSFPNTVWIQNKLAQLFPERYPQEELRLGVLGIQEECLRNYAYFCGARGFWTYASQLFLNKELIGTYRVLAQLPLRYRFPKICILNNWGKAYCLWAVYTAKMNLIKYYVRRIIKR